jgi:hypothetical protein
MPREALAKKKGDDETRVSSSKKSSPPVAQMVTKMTGQLPVMHPLKAVKKNSWNPNRMNPFEKASLKHGFKTEGWLASMALTIWRTDDKGKERNVIIDGEHRWEVALELGWDVGPMVFLDGLTEAQAKALTIKVDARRGRFDEAALTAVLKEIEPATNLETRALDLGISDDRLDILLKVQDVEPPTTAGDAPGPVPTASANVRMVQLVFSAEQHEEWQRCVKELMVRLKKGNVTDAVMEVVRRAAAAPSSK